MPDLPSPPSSIVRESRLPGPARPSSRPDAPVRVLVVDDEPALRTGLSRILSARGFKVTTAEDGEVGLSLVETTAPDVALVDVQMPRMDGMELLRRAKEKGAPTEFVMMTAHAGVEEAVLAVKLGAYQFLIKPFESNDAVAITVAQAAKHKALLDRTFDLEERLLARERFGELIGASPGMLAVYRLIEGVASATSSVLIDGQSGTGKELVARAIHERSPRAGQAFVAVNCGAIPADLVESELFGHVRGAFTGAQASRAGLFETAHGGTIFLDEIGELPLAAQVKLLRTLQEGEVKRVGADETKVVDVRVLAATNVDLKSRIDAGRFRSDLFYRLNVINISLPPLRERGDDVLVLAHHFIDKYGRRLGREGKRLGPEAASLLLSYTWPGNVRELEHAMERAVLLAKASEIGPRDLPAELRPPAPSTPADSGVAHGPTEPASSRLSPSLAELPFAEAKRLAVSKFEEAYTAELMSRAGGNVSEAARMAGMDRSNFKRMVSRKREV